MTISQEHQQIIRESIYEYLLELEQNCEPPTPVRRRRCKRPVPRCLFFKINDICSICLEEMTLEQELAITPCQHTYHDGCLKMVGCGHQVCPKCREMIFI